VRPRTSLQALKAEVRILVQETPVFRAQRKVARQNVVSTSAVQECAFCLGARARHNSVPGGMKDQATASSQRVRTELADVERQVHNHVGCNAMYVSLDSVLSRICKIFLGVAVEDVICFRREPTIDVIAVSHFQTAGVRRSPRDSVAGAVFGEEARSLHAHFIPEFLRESSNRK